MIQTLRLLKKALERRKIIGKTRKNSAKTFNIHNVHQVWNSLTGDRKNVNDIDEVERFESKIEQTR